MSYHFKKRNCKSNSFFVLVVEIVQFKEVGYAIGGSVGDLEVDGGIVSVKFIM